MVRAQAAAGEENKDTSQSVDVHVSEGNQGTSVERRPRRAVDISNLGESLFLTTLVFSFVN